MSGERLCRWRREEFRRRRSRNIVSTTIGRRYLSRSWCGRILHLWRHDGCLFEEIGKTTQLRMPKRPFFFGDVKIVTDVAEELDFHDVDFLHGNLRHLGPSLVCVGIVVENYCQPSAQAQARSKKATGWLHLLPIIRAMVIKRNSLPFLPRTAELNFLSR